MLYDSARAFGYAPNYAWLVFICTLLLIGFLRKEKLRSKTPILITSCVALIFALGFLENHPTSEKSFKASQLPSQTGRALGSNRFAEKDTDNPGFINFGPYFPLPKGQYEVILTYRSAGATSENIGWFDVHNATTIMQTSQIPIYGTSNLWKELKLHFEIDQTDSNFFEFRTYWNGLSNIELQKISITNNFAK
jgi:hypothetical protein